MELREFVAETLKELIAGVKDAQQFAKENGALISPNLKVYQNSIGNSSHPVYYGSDGVTNHIMQVIEFDIAVTTATKDTEKGGIGVVSAILNAGVSSENQDTASEVSRIKFTIPVMFPIQESVPPTAENALVVGKSPLTDL